ncbi:MAG TPA: sulfur carrier protein ThiS, partial [Chloroflexota bacterium]|nr:sulfur carrier protein ThiS [Chloroflexota bacterium]
MQLIVNQQPFEFTADALDVPTLLASRGLKPDGVALAVNGEIVPRRRWTTFTFADGDQVDVVKAVAGGALDDDPLIIAGQSFGSRLLMGSGRFQSPAILKAALLASGAEMVTVAIRMTGVDGSGPDAGILSAIDRRRFRLLPNTAGATSVRQAVFMAELAREAL